MSHLFADIYDGIRFLRILKGVSEKDILNYVQARVGNMKVGNVLKTIRTLRKLVDEGILVKKGKRYSFSGKCPKRDCYETEDENHDECDEDDEGDVEEDDAKDEQQDEDDDDDDDGCGDEEDGEEDDFDDDDDNDEDDNCDNDNQEGGENPGNEAKKMEEDNAKEGKKMDPKSSFIMKPKVEENKGNDIRSNSNATDKTRDDVVTPVSEPESERRRGNRRRRKYLQEASDAENRSTQGIAFCVRDFLDSLQPSKEEETKKNPDSKEMSQEISQSNTESCERLEKFTPRNRGSRAKWDREPHCSYRSRSPVKGRSRNSYDNLNMGRSNNFGSSNALFQEPADNEGEIEEKKREPGPDGPSPQTNTQEGSQAEESVKPLSRDSKFVLEVIESEVRLKESIDNCVPQNTAVIGRGSRRTRLEKEDRRQERKKRGLSNDDIRSYDDKESLCSICDKKRRNS